MFPKFLNFKFFSLLTLILLIGLTIFFFEIKKKASTSPSTLSPIEKELTSIKKPQIWDQVCIHCHSLGGEGGDTGPALDLVGDKYSPEYIASWLKDPSKIKHDTLMPNFELKDSELIEMVTFLTHLKKTI